MTEEVRTDRLSEGLAGSCRDHAVDLRTHEGAAVPPGPEPVVPVRTRDPRVHLANVALEQRGESFGHRDLERPAGFRLRTIEDHAPFLAHTSEMRADPD